MLKEHDLYTDKLKAALDYPPHQLWLTKLMKILSSTKEDEMITLYNESDSPSTECQQRSAISKQVEEYIEVTTPSMSQNPAKYWIENKITSFSRLAKDVL